MVTTLNTDFPSAMAAEAAEIPDRLDAVVAHYTDERVFQRLPAAPGHLYTVARGSSDHAASVLHWVFMRAGVVATTLPPSLLHQRSQRCMHTDTLADSVILGISQSGASPDLADALLGAGRLGASTLALVNQADSPLAQAADTELPVFAGIEQAVAATKSLVCSVVAGVCLANRWLDAPSRIDLSRLGARWRALAQQDASPALAELLGGDGPVLVIGRGTGFGVAGEIALKIQELLGRAAMAYSSAEVLHGPAGMIERGYPVLALEAGVQRAAVADTADRLEALGAHVVRLRGAPPDDELAPLVLLAAVYPAIERACRQAGRSPDRPDHLHKVTLTH